MTVTESSFCRSSCEVLLSHQVSEGCSTMLIQMQNRMERLQATRIYPETLKHLGQNMLETTFWTSCLKRCKMIEIARHTHTTQTLLTQATHRLACKQRKQNHVCTTRLAALQDPQAACSSHPALEANPLQTLQPQHSTLRKEDERSGKRAASCSMDSPARPGHLKW